MEKFRFKWLLKHVSVVLKHKWFVFVAGRQTGVSYWRMLIHDWTKLLPIEALAYARYFNGSKDDPEGFARAWLHHQNCNPHHWEYWIARSGHKVGPGEAKVLEMPEQFVHEMVADWMAASRAYTGSWDMTKWLRENFWTKITLHPKSRYFARVLLYELGYDDKTLRNPALA